MTPHLDLDTLARNALQGLERWLISDSSDAPARALLASVSDAHARKAGAVAECYRERSSALRRALAVRRDSLDGDDSAPEKDALARRMRQLATALPAALPPEHRVPPPATERGPSPVDHVRSAQRASAQPRSPETSTRPVREIPGVGATLEARLKEADVADADAVAALPLERLADILQVSEGHAERLGEQARRLTHGAGASDE